MRARSMHEYRRLSLIRTWKAKARGLNTEVYALYLAYRDPRVSWFARAFAGLVVAWLLRAFGG